VSTRAAPRIGSSDKRRRVARQSAQLVLGTLFARVSAEAELATRAKTEREREREKRRGRGSNLLKQIV
jgi:hypothetical protein